MSAEDQAFDLLVSKFPKRYAVKATRFLRGLVKALAVGDSYIETTVEATRDNLIAVTATGRFLDRAAGRYGIVRGQGTGVLDSDFQTLVPIMGMSPKQISNILLEIIDVFYGPYASHANVTNSAPEPYALSNNTDLLVRVDDTNLSILFNTSDFVSITAATATEVATAISQKTDGKLIGSVVTDTRTGNKFVNIRTHTIGSQGFVQVLGGNAQTQLQFAQVRPVVGSITTWDVARYLGTDEMIYTPTVPPNFASAGVNRGDFVTIRGDSGFDIQNTGTFKVTFVGDTSFRLSNPNGIQELAVTDNFTNDFTFFKPDLGNVLLSSRPAALVETATQELVIILPVTSPIVKRTLAGGQHFHQGVTTVQSTTSNSIVGASLTAFDPIGAIRPLTSRLFSRGVVSVATGATVTLINAENWPTQGAFWSSNIQQFFYYQGITGNTLQGVTPLPPSGLAGTQIVYTERYSYGSITGDTLNGVYPDPTNLVGLEIVAAGAQQIPNYPGSFLFDPKAPFICAENFAILDQTIEQGQVTTLVQVSDVSSFPPTGSFVLEFGSGRQEGPIKYLAKIGTTGLIVDPSHIYSLDHHKGVRLRLVRTLGPYSPRNNGQDLAVYTTSTSPARDLLASYLRLIAAAGIRLRFIIQVPDEKWPVLPNLYTTNPLDTQLVVTV